MLASIRPCRTSRRRGIPSSRDKGQATCVVLGIEAQPITKVQTIFNCEVATAGAEDQELETIAHIGREIVCQTDIQGSIQRRKTGDDELVVFRPRGGAADL